MSRTENNGLNHGMLTALAATAVVLALASAPALAQAPVSLRDMSSTPALSAANTPATAHLLGTAYNKAIVGETNGSVKGHYRWQLSYRLNGAYSRFRALAGVGDKLGAQAAALFEVDGDGTPLFKAGGPQYSGDPPLNFDLDVRGVKQLTLVVSDDGVDPFPKEVVWADPTLYPVGASVPDPPNWPPVVTNAGASAPEDDGPATTAAPPAGSPAPGPVDEAPAPAAPLAPPAQAGPDSDETPQPMAPPFRGAIGQPMAPPFAGAGGPIGGRHTILVVPFRRVYGMPEVSYDLSAEIVDELSTKLHVNVVPIGQAERDLQGASGYLDPEEIREAARMVGARYVIMGAIDKFQLPSGAGGAGIRVPFLGLGVRTVDADVKFDYEIADASGAVIFTKTAEASKSQSAVSGGIFSYRGGVDVHTGVNPDQLMNQTVQAAVDKMVNDVKPVLHPAH